MSNILVGTVPSLPWSTWFLSSETTQGRPFRRKVEREAYAYLDSETISDGQSPVLTEHSTAFSSSHFSEAGSFGLYPSPRPDSVQLHNTALGKGWGPLEMFSTFFGHLLAGTQPHSQAGWRWGLCSTRGPAASPGSSLELPLSFHSPIWEISLSRSITDWHEAECVSAS